MDSPKSAGDISFGIAAAFLFGVLAANMGWNLWLLAALATLIILCMRRIARKYTAAGVMVIYYGMLIIFAHYYGAPS